MSYSAYKCRVLTVSSFITTPASRCCVRSHSQTTCMYARGVRVCVLSFARHIKCIIHIVLIHFLLQFAVRCHCCCSCCYHYFFWLSRPPIPWPPLLPRTISSRWINGGPADWRWEGISVEFLLHSTEINSKIRTENQLRLAILQHVSISRCSFLRQFLQMLV